jgi:hypothetical protein
MNEIHYSNKYYDAGEFIEFAFLAESVSADNIGGVLLYGSDGKLLFTSAFQQMILYFDEVDPGLGLAVFEYLALADDTLGIALLDSCNNLIQFVSYGGAITGTEGPAKGAVSFDIGYTQPDDSPATDSLQRQGCRNGSLQSEWLTASNTRGKLNNLQDVRSCLVIPFVPTAPIVVPTLAPAQTPLAAPVLTMPAAPAATPVAPAPSRGSTTSPPTAPVTVAPTVFLAPTAKLADTEAPVRAPVTLTVETTDGVTFPPPVDDVDTVVVVVAPQHASVVANDDGSVTVVPDDNFHGNDTLSVEYCTVQGSCIVQSYSVNVINNLTSKKSSNKAWLAALVVLPIIVALIAGLYCWHKHRPKQPRNEVVAPEQPPVNVVAAPREESTVVSNPAAPEESTVVRNAAAPEEWSFHSAVARGDWVGDASAGPSLLETDERGVSNLNVADFPFANAEVAKPGYKDQVNQGQADRLPEAVASPVDQ